MLGPDHDAGPPGPPGDPIQRQKTPDRSLTADDRKTYSPYRPPRSNHGSDPPSRDRRRSSLSPSTGAPDRSWSQDGQRGQSQERNRSRGRNGRAPSGGQRTCKKCSEPLTGQFVRALDGTFHLDCFKCRDCDKIVASKFFPAEDEDGSGQYPLCEKDYFRRLGLLCHKCGAALRGSYITALERKYHVDHFTCSLCSTVFGAQDSYYEHESQVYCHYHYSTQFAQKCNGCQTAILKQFVEIFRNGQNQHWHPECYMIHKFWNVRLATPSDSPDHHPTVVDDEKTRHLVRQQEEQMEEKVYRIWSVLSTFEESSAACISDMLLHVSNGSYVDGVVVAKRFIWHVDVLFESADRLDDTMNKLEMKPLSYSREAKLLCKKIVQFFSLLSKTQDKTVAKLGVTQELLSLVTGLAHYLKLLIRICLQGALRIEKDQTKSDGVYAFLEDLGNLETLKNEDGSLHVTSAMSRLAANESDQCVHCRKPVEDECAKSGDKRWHITCVTCARCDKELGRNLREACLNSYDHSILCSSCETFSADPSPPFERITKLQQYVFLLQVALARLLDILKNSGALSASEEASINGHESANGHLGDGPRLQADSRSKSHAGDAANHRESSYENTLNDVRRLRSTRLDKHLSASFRKARSSRLMDDGTEGGIGNMQSQRIEEDPAVGEESAADLVFGHQDALTLDDIPRIVAAEQAREQRPAYKSGRQELFRSAATEPFMGGGRSRSAGRAGEPGYAEPPSQRHGCKYFSELSSLEYFIARHLAVLTMHPMVSDEFSLDELVNLIESKKPATFWNKFGKAFKAEGKKGVKKKGVFGVPLEIVIERDGADSTDGIGPGTLRVPAIVDDLVSTMKKMDLSVEGVFRKNGNIKKLHELVEKIDREGCENINLSSQPVVQVAALLKKYLRELPDPLMTNRLYKLWLTAVKISDEDKRRQCLHLVCCLLPKVHRDCLELLLHFLKWAGHFHQVDDDSGSKMDVRNLATVIAPNILYDPVKGPALDNEPMMAIRVVETLIKDVETICLVPENFLDALADPTCSKEDITSKEILKRFGGRVNGGHGVLHDASAENTMRPLARRVETDPEARPSGGWQEPIPQYANASQPSTPPQKLRNVDKGQKSPYSRSFDGSNEDQRREWRNSTPGRPGKSVGVGGTG